MQLFFFFHFHKKEYFAGYGYFWGIFFFETILYKYKANKTFFLREKASLLKIKNKFSHFKFDFQFFSTH